MYRAERRAAKRRHLIYYSRIMDRNTESLAGRLVDINRSGLMIVADARIEPGKHFRFELMLPDEIEGRDRIRFRAKSIWCRRDVNPDYFAAGFGIEEIGEEDETLIEDMIDRYGFEH